MAAEYLVTGYGNLKQQKVFLNKELLANDCDDASFKFYQFFNKTYTDILVTNIIIAENQERFV